MLVTVGTYHKTIAKTFAMTREQPLTPFALARQGILLAASKGLLPLALQQREERRLADIS